MFIYELPIFAPQVYFCLTLTRDSLFKRNISHFGPTTLRATICSALLTMADVKPGDVVVDPMCGGGSIPIEGKSGIAPPFEGECALRPNQQIL